ncbi:extracellular solute-binding protein [Paenibacillus sp. GYB004]|uniref:ABC transporter substrate-binding protein n=1 Tax=Paenibacillus sp. GYB004 TaxID=2994393 RepID=UPI002F969A49
MNRKGITCMLALTVLVLSACGKTDTEVSSKEATAEKPKEPFTMVIHGGNFNEDFGVRFGKMLAEKFPHIKFEFIKGEKGETIQDLALAGKIPDLIRNDPPVMKANYFDLHLEYDLRELIKTNKYDLKRFNSAFINEITDIGGNTGAIYGLPVSPYLPTVLYYNKDLFEKFGVPYPKDGMSWDELYELAKKMTRVDGGQVYRGFSASIANVTRDNPYSLPIVDSKVDGLSAPEVWTKIFNNLKRFYDIPSNTIGENGVKERDAFAAGNVAMQINQINVYLNLPENVKWDIVSVPYMPDAPKKMPIRGPSYWSITQQSKHKEEAFQVIAAMLSDEVQMRDSRNGMPTTLNNKEIQDALGKDNPMFQNKNMNAVNYYPPADLPPRRASGLVNISESSQATIISEQLQKVARNQADVNTSLREADERIRKLIEQEKSK